jgi:hypothetical protein
MGRRKQLMSLIAVLSVVAIAGVGLGVYAVGTQIDAGPFSMIDSGNNQGDNTGSGSDPVEFRSVSWDSNECGNCYRTDLEAKAPVSSDFEADIFNADPDGDGDYGDYVDYNRSQATKGLTQGVDYFHADGTGVTTLTWSRSSTDISSGTYDIAIDDDASSEEYHTLFTEITVPDTIKFTNYDNNRPSTVVSQSEFDRRANYDGDSYNLVDDNGNDVAFSDLDGAKDLATSAYSSDDEDFTLERELDYQHGKDYLGSINVHDVNSTGTVTADLTITAMVEQDDGSMVEETIFTDQIAEDGSEEDITNDLTDDIDSNPKIVGDTLEAELEVNFDGTAITDGDTLVNASIDDSYGNKVGSDPYMSLTS